LINPTGSRVDFRLLLLTRCVRAFGFGFAAVLVGLHLERRGVAPLVIGVVLAAALAAGSLSGLGFAALSGRYGRRRALAAVGVLMAVAGLITANAGQPWLLVLGGLTGMLGAAGVDLGPFAAIEQAVLTESVPPERRNIAFARYSLSGALAAAAGGLAASPATTVALSQAYFDLYAALGLVTAVLPLLLSDQVEGALPGPVFGSWRPLAGLTALFGLDAFGGGLVVQSVVAYWLHVRFGAGASVLGPTFAAMSLLQAPSYEIAARLANRIGLIRTMVFTHLPSNVLLILVPFAPNLVAAIALLLVRYAIAQMDVPARQAYVVSIVPPSERAGAVAVTGAVRGAAQAAGPALAGLAIQTAAFAAPFVVAGVAKIAYDLMLYAGYRNRRADHEAVSLSNSRDA
jgi:MFS family permease